MRFSEIPGKEQLKKKLTQSVVNNRISHSQLFLGKEGSAKLALAIAYAQFINCTDREKDDSCGICVSCVKYNSLTHPDLHLIFPVLKAKGPKKTVSDSLLKEWRKMILENPYSGINNWMSVISHQNKSGKRARIYKEEASNIYNKIKLKQYEAKYRTILLWLPETMNEATSNSMLKILEEPPQKTIFLLVSCNTSQILDTVLSRLQTINIPEFSKEEINEYFENNSINIKNRASMTHLYGVNLAEIIEHINEKDEKKDFLEDFSTWMRMVYKIDIGGISRWTEERALEGKNHQVLFVEYAIKMVRNCLIYNFADKKLLKTNKEEELFISNFAAFIHEENLFLIVDKLEKTIKYLKRNANSKILFFELSLQMSKYLKLKRKFVTKE